MKKTLLYSFLGICALTACKSDYECCTTTNTSAPGLSTTNVACGIITNLSQNEAEDYEAANSSTVFDSATSTNTTVSTRCNER